MSLKFFERVRRELPNLWGQLEEIERNQLDEEVENLSRLDCDLAAEILDETRFRKLAEQALRNLRKKKSEIPVVA